MWVQSAVCFINMQKIEDFTKLFHLYSFLSQIPVIKSQELCKTSFFSESPQTSNKKRTINLFKYIR